MTIIIDVEIAKAILGRNETPIEGIEYCRGWKDFENMGIACVCVYDTDTHLSRVFFEEDLYALANYLHGKPTAGFNTRRFDLLLLAHNYRNPPLDDWAKAYEPHYDMLEAIWVAQGLDPDKFYWKTHGGWGLDAVCKATLGIAKTGHGALAPVWWQRGKISKVVDYCLNDVWMEGQLLMHIMNGGLVTAEGKPAVRVAPPRIDVVTTMRETAQKDADKVAARIDRDVIDSQRSPVDWDKEDFARFQRKADEADATPPPSSGLGIIR